MTSCWREARLQLGCFFRNCLSPNSCNRATVAVTWGAAKLVPVTLLILPSGLSIGILLPGATIPIVPRGPRLISLPDRR